MIAPTCALSESNFNRIRVVFMKKLFAFFRLPLPKESYFHDARESVFFAPLGSSTIACKWLFPYSE